MKRASRIQMALAIAVLAIGAATVTRADHGNNGSAGTETRLRTRLAGAPIQGKTPEGNADFRSRKGRTEFKTEVENVNLPASTVLDVSVQHGTVTQVVGQLTLSALGFGELELRSQDGDTVPAVQQGDVVIVSNHGAAILSGVF